MLQKILIYFEKQSFGVCTYIGERFAMSTSKLRLFFIYTSVLSVGFPIIFYFFAAFVLGFKNYVKRIRSTIWDF